MTSSKQLVRKLRSVSVEVAKAAIWNGSGLGVDAKHDDYLYELLCYFKVVLLASTKFQVRVTGAFGTSKIGKQVAKWPKKSGLKVNFSYFRLQSLAGAEAFQLCPGIRVVDVHGKPRAPDILLLRPSTSGEPTFSDVQGCWDAKYTSRIGARLPDTAVSDFIFTFQQLGTPSFPSAWSSKIDDPVCQRSGLITNGNQSTEPAAVLLAYGVSETTGFPDNPTTRP